MQMKNEQHMECPEKVAELNPHAHKGRHWRILPDKFEQQWNSWYKRGCTRKNSVSLWYPRQVFPFFIIRTQNEASSRKTKQNKKQIKCHRVPKSIFLVAFSIHQSVYLELTLRWWTRQMVRSEWVLSSVVALLGWGYNNSSLALLFPRKPIETAPYFYWSSKSRALLEVSNKEISQSA